MSLENLLKIGQLKRHEPDAESIARLLEAARRNLHDAGISEVSPENRFDAAYKALMQSALVAMMANGYRPDTSRPGHHVMVLQSLTLTIGAAQDRWQVLDALRRKRNLSDYTGEDIDDVSVENCIAEARRLLADVEKWLKKNRADP